MYNIVPENFLIESLDANGNIEMIFCDALGGFENFSPIEERTTILSWNKFQ